jgi:hypothetical protein
VAPLGKTDAAQRTFAGRVQWPHVEDINALHLSQDLQPLETGGLLEVGGDGTRWSSGADEVLGLLDLYYAQQISLHSHTGADLYISTAPSIFLILAPVGFVLGVDGATSPAPSSVWWKLSGSAWRGRTAHDGGREAALDHGADCRSAGGSDCGSLEEHGDFNCVVVRILESIEVEAVVPKSMMVWGTKAAINWSCDQTLSWEAELVELRGNTIITFRGVHDARASQHLDDLQTLKTKTGRVQTQHSPRLYPNGVASLR